MQGLRTFPATWLRLPAQLSDQSEFQQGSVQFRSVVGRQRARRQTDYGIILERSSLLFSLGIVSFLRDPFLNICSEN